MKSNPLTMSIVCWTGRILALGLFLFWGGVLRRSTSKQWFLHPVDGFPPVWVWLGQLAHLAILIGLIGLWRWPVTVASPPSSERFPSSVVWRFQKAIAEADHLFLAFLAVTIIPALLTLACWFARTHAMTNAKTPLA